MGVSGRPHIPAALPQGRELPIPTEQELGSPQSRSGRFGKSGESLPLPRFEPKITHPVAQSLQRSTPFRLQELTVGYLHWSAHKRCWSAFTWEDTTILAEHWKETSCTINSVRNLVRTRRSLSLSLSLSLFQVTPVLFPSASYSTQLQAPCQAVWWQYRPKWLHDLSRPTVSYKTLH